MNCSPPGSSVNWILQEEYWSGLPCPPPGDLPNPWTDLSLLSLLHWQSGSLPLAGSLPTTTSSQFQELLLFFF